MLRLGEWPLVSRKKVNKCIKNKSIISPIHIAVLSNITAHPVIYNRNNNRRVLIKMVIGPSDRKKECQSPKGAGITFSYPEREL